MPPKSKQDEALQLLDDLDSFAPVQQPGSSPKPNASVNPPRKGNEADVLAFIDEMTQKSAEPTRSSVTIPRSGTPTIRKSTERVRLGGGTVMSNPSASSSTTSLHRTASSDGRQRQESASQSAAAAANAGGNGWGWGSVWSTASAAINQAKSVVDEQVKHLPQNEKVRGWGEAAIGYAKNAQLDKISQDFKRVGLSTLTDILNVVAPPIAEHEVIQIWLSHDMQGYDGVEKVVYRSMSKVMEQVKGGDLVVNRGDEHKPKDGSDVRELNAVDGLDAALKLSRVNVESLVKINDSRPPKPSTINTPTTYSNVYLRIQPYFSPSSTPLAEDSEEVAPHTLQFLVYLYDPEHKLTHTSVTQGVSSEWLPIWDEYDWVEDLVADSLRLGVEVIGQEYVVSRMGWGKKAEDVVEAQSESEPEQKQVDEVKVEDS
ncbi:hypothetical protein FA15DRAFT_673777 [Coprinopsis marcescibilis]|uniref:Maintenance of telomere capping protein 1 n=1 Tax=Coprinopsis marcescibilis TaxID=230819 RepID=A0A5C3KJS1_COPMA|nr:hypothetical protein FA15DRAFT_673777 [Coprinopsis marcescibilis]